MAWVSADRVPQ